MEQITINTVRAKENIKDTNHQTIKPNQAWIAITQLDAVIKETNKSDTMDCPESRHEGTVPMGTSGRTLVDGHHRYVAAHLLGAEYRTLKTEMPAESLRWGDMRINLYTKGDPDYELSAAEWSGYATHIMNGGTEGAYKFSNELMYEKYSTTDYPVVYRYPRLRFDSKNEHDNTLSDEVRKLKTEGRSQQKTNKVCNIF